MQELGPGALRKVCWVDRREGAMPRATQASEQLPEAQGIESFYIALLCG